MKAMILAAGLGTRLGEYTKTKPKALLPLKNVPMLEHIIRYLKANGITEIIINVHHHAQEVIDFLNSKSRFGIHIEISDESDALLNTGGGLKKAGWFFNDDKPFVVTTCDVLTNLNIKDWLAYHKKNDALVSLWTKERVTSRVLLFDPENSLCGWKNKETGHSQLVKGCSTNTWEMAFSAMHIISPKLFELIDETGSFSIMSLYLRLAKNQKIIAYHNSAPLWMEFGRIQKLKSQEKSEDLKRILQSISIK